MNACPPPPPFFARAASVCVCVYAHVYYCFPSSVVWLLFFLCCRPPSLGSFLVLVWVNLDGDVALHIQTIRNL